MSVTPNLGTKVGLGKRSVHSFLGVVQKNPRVRKILVCNSGAGNGCANFMGA